MDQITLVNLALAKAGARSSISSLLESSKEARQASLQYDLCLEAVLQSARWNFARGQAALGLLKDATKSPPDAVPVPWLYEYAYPTDCVQARYLMPITDSAPASAPGAASFPFFVGQPVRFLVATDVDAQGNAQRVILTNQPQAILVYTRRITDTTQFDGQFAQTFVAYLAHALTMPLGGDKKLWSDNFNAATLLAKQAIASNGNEGLTVIDSVPDWIRARGYSSDWAFPPGSAFFTSPQALSMIA